MADGARAHRARFQGNVQIAVGKPGAANKRSGSADSEHLGMSSWVRSLSRPVTSPRDHLAGASDCSADWHFAAISRRSRLLEGNG